MKLLSFQDTTEGECLPRAYFFVSRIRAFDQEVDEQSHIIGFNFPTLFTRSYSFEKQRDVYGEHYLLVYHRMTDIVYNGKHILEWSLGKALWCLYE